MLVGTSKLAAPTGTLGPKTANDAKKFCQRACASSLSAEKFNEIFPRFCMWLDSLMAQAGLSSQESEAANCPVLVAGKLSVWI
jgi:hypothetical protein